MPRHRHETVCSDAQDGGVPFLHGVALCLPLKEHLVNAQCPLQSVSILAVDNYRRLIDLMNEAALFGKLLRATRKAHNLGQSELAERVGISAKHLGRVERGEKLPSFELIVALAKAMGESPSVFFEFENASADERVMKERLQHLLNKRDLGQLRRAYRVLRATLSP